MKDVARIYLLLIIAFALVICYGVVLPMMVSSTDTIKTLLGLVLAFTVGPALGWLGYTLINSKKDRK